MTTIYDVARVSTATVSRVLRGSELVRADTRQRVLGVIEALGFVPDASTPGAWTASDAPLRQYAHDGARTRQSVWSGSKP